MTSVPFTPYWRQVAGAIQPYSFVFFVVAQIAGRHRPIAVVSSRAPIDQEDHRSLQGSPLITACQRIITIFTNETNHPAIRAELALAAGYYMRDGGHKEYHPELVKLPENTRGYQSPRLEYAPWDHTSVREFPFISACLLQGVAFDPQTGFCYQAIPEPLGTIYHATIVEWGMAVVDITELHRVRYGIVGFNSAPMKWASSQEDIYRQSGPFDGLNRRALESGGVVRVVDKEQHRVVISAAEYTIKFPNQTIIPEHDIMVELLDSVPLVHPDALEIIWPVGLDDKVAPLEVDWSKGTRYSLHEQAIRSLLQSTIDIDDFDIAMFDDVREIPNFKEMLRSNIMRYTSWLGGTRSAGLLLRLAFDDGEHLGLEQLSDLSAEAISTAIDVPSLGKISSLSVCSSNIRNLSMLISGLSRSETLCKIYFMQSPFRESDTPDWQLLEALFAQPAFLSKVQVVFAGSYSAALNQNFWLPNIAEKTSASIDTVSLVPSSVFPIQQILVGYQNCSNGIKHFHTDSIYLGDSLLSPELFATGFLTYARTITEEPNVDIYSSAQLFSFSSAPESLSTSTLHSAKISPIPAESFALWDLHYTIRPKVRDLVPNRWTVLVASRSCWETEASSSWNRQAQSKLISHDINYALVRTRNEIIEVENPPSAPPRLDELEVVGLAEFLAITAPELDINPLAQRLREVAEYLVQRPDRGILPKDTEPFSVLDHEDAVDVLYKCLKDARALNQNLRNEMEQNLEGQQWYPELLQKTGDAE